MVVSVGIDPGTRSFDVAAVEKGRLVAARSIPTERLARGEHEGLVAFVRELDPDIVLGPSGYGTPLVCNEDIRDPRTFAERILLLSGYGESVPAVGASLGWGVYVGLLRAVEALWKSGLKACYAPGVIHLPTVPSHRKLNRIDMGTTDKLASTFYIVYNEGVRTGLENFHALVIELGYGYNAVVKVEAGRVTDGHGGTVVSNAFLSIGGLDAEVAAILGTWSREHNFTGGVATVCGTVDEREALEGSSEACGVAIRSMLEWTAKSAYALMLGKSHYAVYLTGRLSRSKVVVAGLEAMGLRASVHERPIGVKESAVGMALIGEALVDPGSAARRVLEWMRLDEACGGTFDWVAHPAFRGIRRAFHEAVRGSLAESAWPRFFCAEDSLVRALL